jgi:hypothetical protein
VNLNEVRRLKIIGETAYFIDIALFNFFNLINLIIFIDYLLFYNLKGEQIPLNRFIYYYFYLFILHTSLIDYGRKNRFIISGI